MAKNISATAKAISMGSVKVERHSDPHDLDRIVAMIWGPPGDGKTTLAATAPGTKLWLSFGDNEHLSVRHRKDVMVAPLYKMSLEELWTQAKNDNPFGLDQILQQNEEIQTIVVDSLTALTFRALQQAIATGVGAGRSFTPTIETPGISAYGARNGLVLTCVTGILRVSAKYGVHVILTAHEDDPTYVKGKEQEGIIDYIGIMLGGKLVGNMTLRLSEIWHLKAGNDGKRTVAIRPTFNRKPMKTRMFRGDQEKSFTLTYNAFKPDAGQMTIAKFWDDWVAGKGVHLNVPK